MTSDMLENLNAVYLQPLRDAIQNLRPSRSSKQARLLSIITSASEKTNLESFLRTKDEELKLNESVQKAQKVISKQNEKMLGSELAQNISLNLSGAVAAVRSIFS